MVPFEMMLFLCMSFVLSASCAQLGCDFTQGNMCDFNLMDPIMDENFKWQLYDPKSSDRSNMTYSDALYLDVPFMYLTWTGETDTVDFSVRAAMSPTMKRDQSIEHCMRLKYRMFGPRVGTLKIHYHVVYASDEPVTHTMFEKSGNQGEGWYDIQIPVDAESPVDFLAALIVEANMVPNWHGEIAIAHLFFEKGKCYEKESISCSFAESCGYSNIKDATGPGATSWLITNVKQIGTPNTDHTSGTIYGKFARVFLDEQTSSKALQSPTVSKTRDRKCVSFFFYLGEGSALQMGSVDESSNQGNQRNRLWLWSNRETDSRNEWVFMETTVIGNTTAIVFRAQKSGAQGTTFVALDDVNISPGSCEIRGNNYFELGSGLYSSNGDFDWIVTSSTRFQGINLKDHTQETTRAHFAVALFDGEAQGNKAKLISPSFRRGEVSCLQFNFHFSDKDAGTLNIHYLNDQKKGNWEAIASVTNIDISSYGDEWNLMKIKLDGQEKNFQVIFEAVAGSKGFGYIAIDDIIFSDTSCLDDNFQINWSSVLPAHVPSETDCNFEDSNLCKWNQDDGSDFHLELAIAGRQSSHWDPGRDHSGQKQGVVLLTPSTKPLNGQGEITSPQLLGNNDGHCMSLWYYINGRGVSIQVFTTLVGQKDDTLFWQRLYDEGHGWQLAEIAMDVKQDFQIKIRMKKLAEEGTAAIDEILYSPKRCMVKKINVVDTCDFETGQCEMVKGSGSDGSWTLFSGPLKTKGGPAGDYTYKTEEGHFLLFDQSNSEAGDVAIQETPTLDVGSDPSKGGQICLRFHYFMYGSDVGTLEVTLTSDKDTWNNYLWRASGDHGKDWIPAEAQVDVAEGSQIEIDFKAIAGDGPNGLFGLDDITMRHGKCSTPGSCTFSKFDSCGWRQSFDGIGSSGWHNYADSNEYGINFRPGYVTTNMTSSMISERFEGGQVHCIHFSFAQLAGKGVTLLKKVPVNSEEDEQLLWKLRLTQSTSFKKRPARVSVYSEKDYEIHISAEAQSADYFIEINNILVTNQPCLAEPAEAVSFDCDFTDGICFWYQDLFDDYDWVVIEDAPFVYLEPAFTNSQAVGRLWSPLIPSGERCLKFSSLRYGADVGYLKLLMEVGHKRETYIDWQGGEALKEWQITIIDVASDDYYQLVFEGMCKTGDDCDIGITNIEISSPGCVGNWKSDAENPRCTFESKSNPLCEWTVSSSKDAVDFTWIHEGGFSRTDANAPIMDFTFGGAGHYAYVAPPISLDKPALDTLKTTLMSPKLQSQKDYPYCMVFAYIMKGSTSGTLNIYQVVPGATGNKNKPVWTAFVSDNVWRKGFASLEQMDDFQVVFEAVATRQTTEGLAIDEIYFQRGPCKTWDKCEFTDDLCLWSNEEEGIDSFDWQRHHHELSLDEGPIEDYTPPGGNGHFLIASSHFAIKDEKAKLLSTMHYPSSSSSNMCLQFFYFMSGKGSVTLDLNLLRGFENAKEPETSLNLWKLETNNTRTKEWLKATVKLDEFLTGKPFKLEFEATMDDGSVAIDDVEIISKECDTTPDEAVTMALALAEASCSFDENNMCGWENAATDPSAPKWEIKEYLPGSYLKRFSDSSTDAKYLSVTSDLGEDKVAILKSPTLPPTNDVECFRFWHYTDSYLTQSLKVKMSLKGSKSLLWNGDGNSWWRESLINLYNNEPFQIYFEAQGQGSLLIEDISIFPGSCPKSDICSFDHFYCDYVEDDNNDYGWNFGYGQNDGSQYIAGIQPSVGTHTAKEKTRLKSSVYAGGGSYCFNFRYSMPERTSGKMNVYAQEVGEDLDQPLWLMPYLKTLDFKTIRSVSVSVSQAKPFQMVFEHTVGVVNGASPIIHDSQMQTHPCEPLGSCDFEGSICSYLAKGWLEISPKTPSVLLSTKHTPFPSVDHTYGVNEGLFMGASLGGSKGAELISPILPKTQKSCLTLAYALIGSAFLNIYKDVDDVGKTLLDTISNNTDHGQVILWNEFKIDFDAEENFVIIVEAQSKSNDGAYASVDDIKVLSGTCEEQLSTEPEKEEKLEIFKDLSCDFEDASNGFCNFKIGKENQGSWVRTQKSSGLTSDHTRNDAKGSFVSMVANSGAQFAEAELEIMSQETTMPGCLSFWYHMSGNTLNTLKVYTEGQTPLWEKTNQDNVVWQHAQVDLISESQKTSQDPVDTDEEFFFFKFEGVLMPNDGHVALDDIQVYTGKCQITDTCTFEEDGQCGFIESNYNSGHWMRKKARDIIDDTSHELFTDHTYGTSEGHFMYCCSQLLTIDTEAKLISPVYKGNPHGRCLVFWTKLSTHLPLAVQVVDKEGQFSNPTYVFSKSWELTHINIRQKTDFQIIFTASGGSAGDRAIDDIQVTPGPCHDLYNCDFTLGFCTWTPREIRHTEWHISSGLPPAGQPALGPKFDHTTRSAAGQYLLLQGSGFPKPSTSQLDSQRVAALGSQALCFSFWYQGPGDILVVVEGSTESYGSYHHDEDDWVHQMITIPFVDVDGTGTMISLIGSVPKGKKNYVAVDDIELLSMPCANVQHEREFSCADNTKIPFAKVCDFKLDCSNGEDEKECGSCTFKDSYCRFVDTSEGQSWEREKADPSATSGPAASAKSWFLYFPYGQYIYGSFETSNTFAMTSSSCKLQFQLYLSKGDMFEVFAQTHMEKVSIASLGTSDWDLRTVFVGNINVPFKLVFEGTVYYSSGIGIDDIEMVDCGFPSAQNTCLRDQFHCSNKACIADYKVCDFQNDCGDFSDESNCQNYIQDDFEYGFGSWTKDQAKGEGSWRLLTTPSSQVSTDHTRGSLRGKVLSCDAISSLSLASEAQCDIASPMLLPTDGTNAKTCEIRLFYATFEGENNEFSIYTRDQTSTTKVPHNSVKEGMWYRVRATLHMTTSFQIIVTGLNKDAGLNSKNFLVLDDISLTEGCIFENDKSISVITTEHELLKQPTAKFVESTEATTSADGSGRKDHKDINVKPGKDPQVSDTKPNVGAKPKDKDDDNEESTNNKSKKSSDDLSKKNQGSWQLPVGISLGVVGLAAIVILVVIYLRRTNRLFSHTKNPIHYVNELYNQNEEPQEMEVTNYGSSELMPDIFGNDQQSEGNVMSLENPSYEEFEG